MTQLLEVRDLSVGFPLRGRLPLLPSSGPSRLNIVKDISFNLGPGQTLGLVGESGSGKTTVIRAINGLIPRDGGEVQFEGRSLSLKQASYTEARRRMAMLFQDPVSSLSPRMSVGSLLLEPFAIHGVPVADKRTRLAEMLDSVGLPPGFGERHPHELSGGQARRVGVARALALEPSLILADEPTAGLDVSIQGQVLNLLGRLQRSRQISYILVTHNLAIVRRIAHFIGIMYLGRLVEFGPAKTVFNAPRHPYTKALIDAQPIPDPDRLNRAPAIRGEIPSLLNRPAGCGFSTRCAFARQRCHKEPPPLTSHAGRSLRCHYPLDGGAAAPVPPEPQQTIEQQKANWRLTC